MAKGNGKAARAEGEGATLSEIDEALEAANEAGLGDADPEARIRALEDRCHLLTQAIASLMLQQPNRYRTEIVLLARGEAERRRLAEEEADQRRADDLRARQAAAAGR